jgi:Uncharacterized conserved protein
VACVPRQNPAVYRRMALEAVKIRRRLARRHRSNVSPTTSCRASSRPAPQTVRHEDGQAALFCRIVYASRSARSHRQTGHGRPRLASLTSPKSLPPDGERMFLAASRCPSRRSADLIPTSTAHRLGATRARQPSRRQRSGRSWSRCRMDVQHHLAPWPAAISASRAMVFMLRAVPDFATGIFSRESAMPSP